MGSKNQKLAQIFIATDISQKLRSALEFGAVISIVMLLTILALKNYETIIVRAQLSEAFNLTSTVRAEMIVYRAQHGHWPNTAAELHNPTLSQEKNLGQFVDHMTLNEDGSLSTFFGGTDSASLLSGRQLTMRPMLVTGNPGSPVFWACSGYSAPDGVSPSGPDKTDIDLVHLPASCRDY